MRKIIIILIIIYLWSQFVDFEPINEILMIIQTTLEGNPFNIFNILMGFFISFIFFILILKK